MRYTLRTLAVGLMITSMSIPPAVAWHCCGAYEPAYYGWTYDGCCGELISYDDCGGCGSCDGCNSCGDCGACDGYDSGCESCGTVVTEATPTETSVHETAPLPPTEPEPIQQPREVPSTVDRPVETTPPMVEPTLPPSDEPADDSLFDSSEEPTPPQAPESDPVPAEEPSDLFGEPADTTPAVETSPPADTAPSTETTTPPVVPPADEPADDAADLFGEPAETNTPVEEPAVQPTDTAPEEEPADDDSDDIFGATRGVMDEPGGLTSTEMRVWIDNTGSFSCRARLVSWQDSHVRLLKENGRTATVPLHRLSPSDLEFVHRQANAQQGEEFHTASR